MNLLFYDTETTGLPDFKAPSDDPGQPYITQLAASLVDGATREVQASINFLITPEGWVIPPDLEKLTGITTARAIKYGVPIGVALPLFLNMWRMADRRVAHNESFDARMIRIMMFRDAAFSEESADKFKSGLAFCTMNAAKPICQLPPSPKMVEKGMTGFKAPNLGEAYEFFTGSKLEGAHNAAIDVAACMAIYFAINK